MDIFNVCVISKAIEWIDKSSGMNFLVEHRILKWYNESVLEDKSKRKSTYCVG